MITENMKAPAPPVGIIESLSLGFEAIAGRLLLALVPLAVDLFLWVGPRLDLRPVVERTTHTLIAEAAAISARDAELQALQENLEEGLQAVTQDLPVSYLPLLGLPSLITGQAAQPLPFGYSPPLWRIETPAQTLAAAGAAAGASLLLLAIYLSLIADQVRLGRLRVIHRLKRLPVTVIQMAILGVLVLAISLTLYLPFLLVGSRLAAAGGMGSQIGQVITLGGLVFLLWVGLFGIFALHGLFLNERSLPGAIWDSIRVVQWNTSATMGLFILVIAINWALTRYIWSWPETGSWLIIAGMLGHAFVSTGLIAATFVFFKDRHRYWQEMRSALLAELERKRAGTMQGR